MSFRPRSFLLRRFLRCLALRLPCFVSFVGHRVVSAVAGSAGKWYFPRFPARAAHQLRQDYHTRKIVPAPFSALSGSSVIGHPTLPASERGRKCERTPSHLRTGQKNRPSSGSQRGFVPRLGPRLVCCRNLCSAHFDRYQSYSHHQPYSASREFLAEVLYSPALTGVLVPQIQLWSFLRRPLLRGFLRRPALSLLRLAPRLGRQPSLGRPGQFLLSRSSMACLDCAS